MPSGVPKPNAKAILQGRNPKPMGTSTSMWTEPLRANDAWASTPSDAGLYRWFLHGPLPESFNWPSRLSPLLTGDLLYVGKANSLRTRAKHHRLPTPGSTLRRTFASLVGYPAVWRGKSAHPGISEADNALLTEWMSNNLLMSFRVLEAGEVLKDAEAVLRNESQAPLNKDYMNPEQEHASAVGKLWRLTATDLRG